MIYNIIMKFIVELYKKENNQCPVLDFITSLKPKQQAKIEREIDLLEEFGIELLFPHTRKLEGEKYKDLWELRIKQGTDSFRIFYFMYIGNKYVFLHGIVKKSNKTPVGDIEIALKRMQDYIRRYKK